VLFFVDPADMDIRGCWQLWSDDERDFRHLWRLKRRNADDVAVVGNGTDALRQAQAEPPDLVRSTS
jgi:hypothetical protein